MIVSCDEANARSKSFIFRTAGRTPVGIFIPLACLYAMIVFVVYFVPPSLLLYKLTALGYHRQKPLLEHLYVRVSQLIRLPGYQSLHLVRRSEEHTSELQSRFDLVCRLLL